MNSFSKFKYSRTNCYFILTLHKKFWKQILFWQEDYFFSNYMLGISSGIDDVNTIRWRLAGMCEMENDIKTVSICEVWYCFLIKSNWINIRHLKSIFPSHPVFRMSATGLVYCLRCSLEGNQVNWKGKQRTNICIKLFFLNVPVRVCHCPVSLHNLVHFVDTSCYTARICGWHHILHYTSVG